MQFYFLDTPKKTMFWIFCISNYIMSIPLTVQAFDWQQNLPFILLSNPDSVQTALKNRSPNPKSSTAKRKKSADIQTLAKHAQIIENLKKGSMQNKTLYIVTADKGSIAQTTKEKSNIILSSLETLVSSIDPDNTDPEILSLKDFSTLLFQTPKETKIKARIHYRQGLKKNTTYPFTLQSFEYRTFPNTVTFEAIQEKCTPKNNDSICLKDLEDVADISDTHLLISV